jgi:hypothetical protein
MAAYHDVACQKKHYAVHKKQCRAMGESQYREKKKDSIDNPSNCELPYHVKNLPDKGLSLIATQGIEKGKSIAGDVPSTIAFAPVVPPVLFQNQRNMRCAVCFGTITDNGGAGRTGAAAAAAVGTEITLCHDPRYMVKVCRLCHLEESHNNTTRLLLEQEIEAIQATPQIPKILPTAILIFRICLSVAQKTLSWETILDHMISHPLKVLDHHQPDAAQHEQAVVLTVMALLQATTTISRNNRNIHLTQDMSRRIQSMLSIIKVNAFTITNDNAKGVAENTLSLGLGLFHVAHFINHSCVPNTRQSFRVGKPGQLPALQLTAQSTIAADQEITISYIETNQRTYEERQAELQESYQFTCKCLACTNQQRT